MNRTVSRTGRTFLQLVAAGGLTGLVSAVANGLSAWVAGIVLAAGTLAVTCAQAFLESHGVIAPVLESGHTELPPR